MRIIHMSDLHVGWTSSDGTHSSARRLSRIVAWLIENRGSQAGECVLVFTGDQVDDANDGESAVFVRERLDELKSAGFERILLCPGNHDYGTGTKGDKKFVSRFKDNYFSDESDWDRIYPKVNIFPDDHQAGRSVAFLGLDSMAEELTWRKRFFAEGKLGKKQRGRLADRLRSDEIMGCAQRVVYLHHHPFEQHPLHNLKDYRELLEILRAAHEDGVTIDALLYGHNHLGQVADTTWCVRCYDAGSATEKMKSKWGDYPRILRVQNRTREFRIDELSLPRLLDFQRRRP